MYYASSLAARRASVSRSASASRSASRAMIQGEAASVVWASDIGRLHRMDARWPSAKRRQKTFKGFDGRLDLPARGFRHWSRIGITRPSRPKGLTEFPVRSRLTVGWMSTRLAVIKSRPVANFQYRELTDWLGRLPGNISRCGPILNFRQKNYWARLRTHWDAPLVIPATNRPGVQYGDGPPPLSGIDPPDPGNRQSCS